MTAQSLTIVLTGATRGLGRALAVELSRKGHRVLGCGRNADAVRELGSNPGPPDHFCTCEVGYWDSVLRWSQSLLDRVGAPDLLINNAAIINRSAPLWRITVEEFDSLQRINISGTANVIRAFLPAMLKRGSGMVVNMSSGAGRMGLAESAPYCASKWAIEGLTRSLALELPDGVGAVALSPGMVNTDMLRTNFGPDAERHQSPDEWVRGAAEFILNLSPGRSGKSLTVPASREPDGV